jgi:hypothetical protein
MARSTSTVNDTNHRPAVRDTVADKMRAVPAPSLRASFPNRPFSLVRAVPCASTGIPVRRIGDGAADDRVRETLVITERAVSKHIGNVLLKLGLPPTDIGHRRVLAVLAYLNNA